MGKVKLYIAASVDGFIARTDGDIDWLTGYPNPSKEDYGYKDFFESVDTVIMGGRTYLDILAMDVVWPYPGKKSYIVTHNPLSQKENIDFITENVIERISGLKQENGKNIWLVGGGELVSMLLDNNLVDEMIITYIPVVLGNGIRLFQGSSKESNWRLAENKSFDNNVIQVTYQRIS